MHFRAKNIIIRDSQNAEPPRCPLMREQMKNKCIGKDTFICIEMSYPYVLQHR